MMGRRFMAVLCLALLMVLAGCQEKAPTVADTQIQTTEAPAAIQQPLEGEQVLTEEEQQVVEMIESEAGEAPAADEYSWEVLEGTSQADGILIQASCFTLQLPQDWDGHYVVEESGNWLYLYSKENQEAGYGGLLGYVAWIGAEDRNVGADAQFTMGQAVIDGEPYEVVAEVMTEAQTAEEGQLREQYLSMRDDMVDVLGTIQFDDGIEFTFAE